MDPEEHECCWHPFGQPFVRMVGSAIHQYPVAAMEMRCCWHQHTKIHYQGIEEEGHGPGVSFDPKPLTIQSAMPPGATVH